MRSSGISSIKLGYLAMSSGRSNEDAGRPIEGRRARDAVAGSGVLRGRASGVVGTASGGGDSGPSSSFER